MATRRTRNDDDASGAERTVVSDFAPQFTADPPEPQGAVFDEASETRHDARRAAKDTMGDIDETHGAISLIEAESVSHGLSAFGDGVVVEDGANPSNTEVLSLPSPPDAAPVDVTKWKAAPDGAKEARGAMRAVELPATKLTQDPTQQTRAESVPAAVGAPLDKADVERMVAEALELVRTARAQASRLDIEVGRGLNAQLSLAMHRLSELLGKLRG